MAPATTPATTPSTPPLYYPWIKVFDPATGQTRIVPPSGHMAGVWARNDSERGVHKAPANEVVRGAVDLETQITRGEQDLLNPVGVNCIRAFPGRGIRVWGARTLSSDPAWRYLNVRRYFNYLEESILIGTQWVVFEPNDDGAVGPDPAQRSSAFLVNEWRTGALFGTSARGGVLSSSATRRPTPPSPSTWAGSCARSASRRSSPPSSWSSGWPSSPAAPAW